VGHDPGGKEVPMATLLDEHLVSDALHGLDHWTLDGDRIRRTVELPSAAIDRLLAEVAVAADAMDHHPETDRQRGRITFTLWTHSAGGVTELDIALASRIDDLILLSTGRHRGGSGEIMVMEPAYPSGERSRPSRATSSTTGGDRAEKTHRVGKDAATMNQPANPRAGAGAPALPDAEPNSIEPSAGPAGPGLQERVDDESS
jgi:4a-hydroxytetrahydrobiopterin dehydratase